MNTIDYLEISNVSLENIDYAIEKIDVNNIPSRATYILQPKDIAVSTVRPNRNAVAFINDYNLIGTSGFTVLRCDETKISPYYLYTFCKTKHFIKKLIRENTSSMYPAVSEKDIKNINIPKVSNDFQLTIEKFIVLANNYLLKSKMLYSQAENILNKELGIDNFKPSDDNISIIKFSDYEQKKRFDAEYYQPKYDDYKKLLSTKDTINTICNIYDNNYTPIKDKKYMYIELANIGNVGNIQNVEEIEGYNLPTRARRLIKKGQVIVSSIEGSLSSCAMITEEYDNAICSTGFYVVDSNEINSETLLVLFKSKPIQELLKQGCSGTILTAISKEAFTSIPLPKIDTKIQNNIAEKIQESFKLRKKARDLLNLAKQVVETAIEKNENEALKLINDYTNEKDEYFNSYNENIPMVAEDTDKFKSKN